MFLFLFVAIITNACGKNSQKPEIGSMIHPTTAKAKMQYPKTRGAGFCSFLI